MLLSNADSTDIIETVLGTETAHPTISLKVFS